MAESDVGSGSDSPREAGLMDVVIACAISEIGHFAAPTVGNSQPRLGEEVQHFGGDAGIHPQADDVGELPVIEFSIPIPGVKRRIWILKKPPIGEFLMVAEVFDGVCECECLFAERVVFIASDDAPRLIPIERKKVGGRPG